MLLLILLILLIIPGALALWGVVIEPRLIDEESEMARVPGLPSRWEGRTVALIADFQLGMWLNNADTARRVVERLEQAEPALVLIAGDFVYHPTEDDSAAEAGQEFDAEDEAEVRALVERAARLVAPLPRAGIRTYAVLGNHDYAMEADSAIALPWVADAVERALEGVGVQVLRNEAVSVGDAASDDDLYVVGIDAAYPQRSNVSRALAGVPAGAPRLALMHNPTTFSEFPAGTAPFAVAAHTHGGQVRLPLLPSWSWLEIVRRGDVHADGWAEPAYGARGNRLYVNRGIGFSTLPVRINCPPELTYFTLTGSGS